MHKTAMSAMHINTALANVLFLLDLWCSRKAFWPHEISANSQDGNQTEHASEHQYHFIHINRPRHHRRRASGPARSAGI